MFPKHVAETTAHGSDSGHVLVLGQRSVSEGSVLFTSSSPAPSIRGWFQFKIGLSEVSTFRGKTLTTHHLSVFFFFGTHWQEEINTSWRHGVCFFFLFFCF